LKPLTIDITTVVSSPFEENSYIFRISSENACLIVDPGLEPEKIIVKMDKMEVAPVAILVTHGHSDHIAGNGALKQRWPHCPIVVGRAEAPKLTDPDLNLSSAFGVPMASPAADVLVDDGDIYEAGGIRLKVLSIPGHSLGHVVYQIEGCDPAIVFVGDVIFRGSVGRTDFPDGDFQQLYQGIRDKLFTLSDETLLYPGHGSETTVGHEKKTNPFVGQRARTR
jgi:glyoxylase-like metal-dependent hydrolase (beta-lactamase superfamily II)